MPRPVRLDFVAFGCVGADCGFFCTEDLWRDRTGVDTGSVGIDFRWCDLFGDVRGLVGDLELCCAAPDTGLFDPFEEGTSFSFESGVLPFVVLALPLKELDLRAPRVCRLSP